MTRSVERRIAAMKGEPAPQFDGGKMLKEEKELRKFYSVAYPSEADEIKRDFKKMLTALVRAVRKQERERCAKLIASECKKKTLDSEPCKICAEMIAAIRKG